MASFRALESHYCQFFWGLYEQSFSRSEAKEESEHKALFFHFCFQNKKRHHLSALIMSTFVMTLEAGWGGALCISDL